MHLARVAASSLPPLQSSVYAAAYTAAQGSTSMSTHVHLCRLSGGFKLTHTFAACFRTFTTDEAGITIWQAANVGPGGLCLKASPKRSGVSARHAVYLITCEGLSWVEKGVCLLLLFHEMGLATAALTLQNICVRMCFGCTSQGPMLC